MSFQNVSFSYDKFPVLEDISLDIEPGEKVAFVGGSGKSTMMKLLLSFYQPDKGTIRIFGTDAETYNLKGIRGFFAYVPQQPGCIAVLSVITFCLPGLMQKMGTYWKP